MLLDYLQSDPGSGAMFLYYLQATSEKNENGIAFKRLKNSVNRFFGENVYDPKRDQSLHDV